MKFLADTNIISELRKGSRADPGVLRWANATPSAEIATSVLVLAEIRHGIESKRRRDSAQAEALDAWFAQIRRGLGSRVLPVSEDIADRWARLSVPDRLPLVDGLLAATALVHGLALVTRNVADMRVAGLTLVNPFEW